MLKELRSVAVLAAACNEICLTEAPAPRPQGMRFVKGGEERLVDLAAGFSQLLEVQGNIFRDWKSYRDYVANMACEVGSAVFSHHPEKTGALLAFYLLTRAGFRRKRRARWQADRMLLESAIVQGEFEAVVDAIGSLFHDPDNGAEALAN